MKKILFLLALSLATLDAKAEETIKIKSKVKEATIFFSGAEVVHEAEAHLSKGANNLIIEGLSHNIDVNSIRVKANKGVLVSSFEFMVESLDNNVEIKKMQDTLDNYRSTIGKIQSKIQINNNFSQMLQSTVDKGISGKESGTDDIIKLMEYYDEKMKATEESTFQLKTEEKALNTKIAEINVKIQQAKSKNVKNKGALKLSLSSPTTSQCTFNIMYYTYSASWVAYHDVNVLSLDNPIKITSKAKVTQTTGIDWEQVKLKLSTSMPSFGKTVPLFKAWILQQPKAPQAYTKNSNLLSVQNSVSYDKKTIITDNEEEAVDELIINEVSMDEHVVLSDNNLNITYDIDLPYTIPGNGNIQNIELQTQEIAAEYKYYCAPKLDPNTFLIAEIKNWEKLNLLTGTANITYDDTYIGETYIDAASTKDALVLALGVDKRVAVKREKVNEMSSTKPFGNDIKQEFTYRLTVRNNQNKSINLVLKDQYPKSEQKQVEVILSKDTTTPTFNNEDVGVISWEQKLDKGESRSYTISYSVKYPKNMVLNLP
ncbi:MAG: DUF4139 domain-containing protein [Prevotellaceae bacterium]|jgi:uncharacterized protein (TIGR02231 family)|nr:DUF4139 domain-containing protein [Prevotellaceae bacterium]